MEKKRLSIRFADFWGGFNYDPTRYTGGDNTLFDILSERFAIDVNDDPDILVYSVFGSTNRSIKARKRVFFTGENIRPNMADCDYSISFDHIDDPRCLRFPLSAITLYENNVRGAFPRTPDPRAALSQKTRFCNFVFSNANAPHRNDFLARLSRYKTVDCGGRAFNNTGGPVSDKLGFIRNHKFTICFENSEHPGYTTEKLVHPKLVDSIPIYWGNPEVARDWNTRAIISAYDFRSLDELVDFVREADRNDSICLNLLSEPHFNNERPSPDLDPSSLHDFFDGILLGL